MKPKLTLSVLTLLCWGLCSFVYGQDAFTVSHKKGPVAANTDVTVWIPEGSTGRIAFTGLSPGPGSQIFTDSIVFPVVQPIEYGPSNWKGLNTSADTAYAAGWISLDYQVLSDRVFTDADTFVMKEFVAMVTIDGCDADSCKKMLIYQIDTTLQARHPNILVVSLMGDPTGFFDPVLGIFVKGNQTLGSYYQVGMSLDTIFNPGSLVFTPAEYAELDTSSATDTVKLIDLQFWDGVDSIYVDSMIFMPDQSLAIAFMGMQSGGGMVGFLLTDFAINGDAVSASWTEMILPTTGGNLQGSGIFNFHNYAVFESNFDWHGLEKYLIQKKAEICITYNGVVVHRGNVTVRIGGYTRRWYPNKSLVIDFAKGDRLDLKDFGFPKNMEAVYLRQIDTWSGISDWQMNEIARNLNIGGQKGTPVVVYLNGEYYGLCILMEKVNRGFVEDHTNYDKKQDSIMLFSYLGMEYHELVGGMVVPLSEAFSDWGQYVGLMNPLRDYFETEDMTTPAAAAFVHSQMDTRTIWWSNLFTALMARGDEESGNTRLVGLWNRYVMQWLKDLDHCANYSEVATNTFSKFHVERYATDSIGRRAQPMCTRTGLLMSPVKRQRLFNELLDLNRVAGDSLSRVSVRNYIITNSIQNLELKTEYQNALPDLVALVFNERSISIIDSTLALLAPHWSQHQQRWAHVPTVPSWSMLVQQNEQRKQFIQERPPYAFGYFMQDFPELDTTSVSFRAVKLGDDTTCVRFEHEPFMISNVPALPDGQWREHTRFTDIDVPITGENIDWFDVNGDSIAYEFMPPNYVFDPDSIYFITAYYGCEELDPNLDKIRIYEAMVANLDTLFVDENGERENWFELLNPTGFAIDLFGLNISDKRNNLDKFMVTCHITIYPGERLVIWADEDSEDSDCGARILHTNFRFDKDGPEDPDWDPNEGIYLSLRGQVAFDSLRWDQAVPRDSSWNVCITGNQISAPTPFAANECSNANVLPVELITWTVTNMCDEIVCAWATASELNSHFFEVEFSLDGINFQAVGQTVDGHGTTSQSHAYELVIPVSSLGDEYRPNATVYARLRQVDYDFSYEYGDKVVFQMCASMDALSVFPNPPQNGMVTISGGEGLYLGLFSVDGAVVKEFFVDSDRYTLNIAGIAPGMYFIQSTENQTLQPVKIIVP